MKCLGKRLIGIIVVLSWSAGPVWGARPYKTYVLKHYKRWDILCDTYIVQKGDHIWELLRRRGSIAERDFPRFVVILKSLNPHIKNVDRIYPQQEILIPLKQTERREGPSGPDDRFVTIPFLPDILSTTYTVRPGDWLLKIAAEQHGLSSDQLPERYLEAVQQVNPDIEDLNRIYPGHKIRIPEIGSVEMSSETALLVPGSANSSDSEPAALPETYSQGLPQSPVSLGIKRLGGTLIESGHYFFPTEGKRDLKLDLSAYPVIELQDGRRLLLVTGEGGLPEDFENAMRAFWKSLIIIRTEQGEVRKTLLDKIFRAIYGSEIRQTLNMPVLDDGIQVTLKGDWIFRQKEDKQNMPVYYCMTLIAGPEERTSAALQGYLAERNVRVSDLLLEAVDKDSAPDTRKIDSGQSAMTLDASNQEAFAEEFVKAMGYSYDRHAPLSLEYAGFQIQTVTDLIHGADGQDVVVDFGTLYGDARSTVEAAGLKVVSIKPQDEPLTIARNILKIAGISWTEAPVFFGANRDVFKTISLGIPGLLISSADQGRTLLTPATLPPKVCDFLGEKEIRVLNMTHGN